MKRPTKLKEVTNQWVKDNFTLDDERTVVLQRTIPIDVTDVILSPGQFSLSDFVTSIKNLQDSFKDLSSPHEVKVKVTPLISNWEELHWRFEVYAEYEELETDSQVVTRIRRREKQKIHEDVKLQENMKVEKKERELLESLLVKYSDEVKEFLENKSSS